MSASKNLKAVIVTPIPLLVTSENQREETKFRRTFECLWLLNYGLLKLSTICTGYSMIACPFSLENHRM
jgi:hypothetical protein